LQDGQRLPLCDPLSGASRDFHDTRRDWSANLRVRVLIDRDFSQQANAITPMTLLDNAGSDPQITHHSGFDV
jgi:hypothetical protein